MSDDMLISFDSPAPAKTRDKIANRNGLSSPLIPCPSTPFDLVASQPGDDPFELEPQDPFGPKPAAHHVGIKTRTPERNQLAPPVLDIPILDAATPSPLLLRRAISDVDISGVVPGQYLVSSTPLVSSANTPTRSSHSVPRRSLLSIEGSALIKSKLDFLNKVNQGLAVDVGNSAVNRSKSISNLPETLNTSVQYNIFSIKKNLHPPKGDVIARRCRSTNNSPPMNSSKTNCGSFMLEPDGFSKHETSGFLSFLTSPKHTVGATITPEEIHEEARKMQLIFHLCAVDGYEPMKEEEEEEGWEWVNSACLPDSWFDPVLDYDSLLTGGDSDEDTSTTMPANRISNQQEMEAIKIRLNRFRRSTGSNEDTPVKGSEGNPIVKINPDSVVQSASGLVEVSPAPVKPPVEAQPVVVPPVLAPKLPIVPELRPKAPNPFPAKKGPLKAVEPMPNMIKKSHSSDMLKVKPALAGGRLSRPVSEQGPRRQGSPASRRSSSEARSPLRSSAPPQIKSLRPPVKLPGIRPKTTPSTVKGKENRF